MEMPAMTDIVERLRMQEIADCDEAADEIERLRGLLAWHDSTVPEILADNTRLRALLQELIDIEGPQPGTADWAEKVRPALTAGKPDAP
jgi:hypothetical protein